MTKYLTIIGLFLMIGCSTTNKIKPIVVENLNQTDSDKKIKITWSKLDITKRQALENEIDNLMRKNNFGYCSGGDNGKEQFSEVNIYVMILKENENIAVELLNDYLRRADLFDYEINIIPE